MREATPDNVVVALQEELIAVKLREAEATLALKELRPKISELSSQWLRHLQVSVPQYILDHPTGWRNPPGLGVTGWWRSIPAPVSILCSEPRPRSEQIDAKRERERGIDASVSELLHPKWLMRFIVRSPIDFASVDAHRRNIRLKMRRHRSSPHQRNCSFGRTIDHRLPVATSPMN